MAKSRANPGTMKRVLKYIGRYKYLLPVSLLLALVCFGVAVILLLKIYVDKRGNFPPLAVELVSAAEETDEEDEEIVDDDTDFIEDENEADMINAVSNEIKE